MKSGPVSVFLSESDNSVKLFKRPSKPLGSLKWPVPVDFGKQGKLQAFPPITPLGLKKKPIQASPRPSQPWGPSLQQASGTRAPGGWG